MEKVLVTGGAGFVGLALVRRLAAQGLTVFALARHHSEEVEKAGAEMVCGDIRDAAFLATVTQGCDTVFHVAAKAGIWGNRDDYFSVNLTGTENVIAACEKNNISTLVYTSTPSVVFDRDDIVGGDESLQYPEKFLCHYAESKHLAEKRILAANRNGMKTVALRPHLIWGPGDTNLIPRLLERGKRGLLKQVGDGLNKVDISYIDNVVDAHIQAALDLETNANAAGKAYFISQGESVFLWDWINDLFGRLGVPPVKKKVSFKKAYMAGTIMELIYQTFGIDREPLMTRFLAEQLAKSHWFSIDNARKDFGYSPKISNEEGMRCLVSWLGSRIG